MRASKASRQGNNRFAPAGVVDISNHTLRYRRAPDKGSYLLEFALAALAVAFFIVGVSDLAKIFHARSAIHAGVTEGLRCLYPTDPTCANVTLSNAEIGSSRYNAWVWGSEGTLLPQSSYLVSASLFNEPMREVSRVASRISSLQVKQGSSGYAPHTVQFPVAAHAPYLLTIRDLPRIGGADPMRPTFVDRYTNRAITPNRAFAIQAIRGFGERSVPNAGRDEYHSSFEIGARSFTLSDAWTQYSRDAVAMRDISIKYGRDVPCYKGELDSSATSPRIRWSLSRAPEVCAHRVQDGSGSTTQRNLLQGTSLQVPIMVRVSGVPVGMSGGAVGKVVARLEWRGSRSSGSRELGGRVFSNGSSGNLIVRGADKSDIQNSAWQPYQERYLREIELHGTLPLIPLDATVTVRLFLSSVSGDPVGWEGREIEVFYPRYQLTHETHSCGYSPNPGVCERNIAPVRPLYTAHDTSRELVSKQESSRECRRNEPTPLEESTESVLGRLAESIRRGETPQGYTFWLAMNGAADACDPVVRTYACTDDFKEHLRGCRPEYPSEYLRSRCQIDDFREELDQISEVLFDEQNRPTADRRGACSDEPFPECAAPHIIESGTRFLGAGSNNCSSAINVSPASERSGPFYDNVCEPVSERIRNRYRKVHKIPSEIPISVISLAEPPVYSASVPSDSCVANEPTGEGDGRRVLCGRSVSRLAARRCCERHEGRCSLEELPPPPGSVHGGLTRVIEEAAEIRVIETIQAIYPPAKSPTGCDAGSENCINVDARVVGNDSTARVQASVKVPLTFTSWFRGDGITLQYQEERALERALMNG